MKGIKWKQKLENPNILVDVIWLDACGYGRGDKFEEEVLQRPTSLLEETHTYGILYSEDEHTLLILQEQNTGEGSKEKDRDFTVIPKKWVYKITKYYKR